MLLVFAFSNKYLNSDRWIQTQKPCFSGLVILILPFNWFAYETPPTSSPHLYRWLTEAVFFKMLSSIHVYESLTYAYAEVWLKLAFANRSDADAWDRIIQLWSPKDKESDGDVTAAEISFEFVDFRNKRFDIWVKALQWENLKFIERHDWWKNPSSDSLSASKEFELVPNKMSIPGQKCLELKS